MNQNIIIQIKLDGKLISYIKFPSFISKEESDWLKQSKLYLKEEEIRLNTIVGFYHQDMKFKNCEILIDNR